MAPTITEAEKSYDLPPASWRPGKARDKIQSESEGLRYRGTDGVTLRLKPKEVGVGG